MTEPVYILISLDGEDNQHVELFDSEPAPSLIREQEELWREGRVRFAEIRVAHINGGDSESVWMLDEAELADADRDRRYEAASD